MTKESSLKGKVILAVDDEPDVLEVIGEELDLYIVHKAKDYNEALQYMANYTYDAVVLDIMGASFCSPESAVFS